MYIYHKLEIFMLLELSNNILLVNIRGWRAKMKGATSLLYVAEDKSPTQRSLNDNVNYQYI